MITPSQAASPTFEKIVLTVVEQATKRIVEEEALAAGKRVEQRVREAMGGIAANISRHVEYQFMADKLTITVRFPEEKK